jgi:hypothetical protein
MHRDSLSHIIRSFAGKGNGMPSNEFIGPHLLVRAI